MQPVADLPPPSDVALQVSRALQARIAAAVEAAGGVISFARYMEMCLYEPGLGYYSAGARRFGPAGDFITAPEVSPLFGRCLAQSAAAVLGQCGGDVLEFGAGTGRLAVDLLGELAQLDALPGRYFILERSAALRAQQQATLAAELPSLQDRVSWLDSLPGPGFNGFIVANEVLDAMACECFQWDGTQALTRGVRCSGNAFDWQLQPADEPVGTLVGEYAAAYGFMPGYRAELNLAIAPWLSAIAAVLERGMLLLIDYGYTRREYFHPQRTAGTLQCHYRQRVHDDPFFLPGLQDITAHVDFTAVAEAAVAAGLDVAGYTTQAFFLADCGLDRLLQQAGPSDSVAYLRLAQQAKTLVLPGEMGERFQCMGIERGLDDVVPGFRLQDMRGRL